MALEFDPQPESRPLALEHLIKAKETLLLRKEELATGTSSYAVDSGKGKGKGKGEEVEAGLVNDRVEDLSAEERKTEGKDIEELIQDLDSKVSSERDLSLPLLSEVTAVSDSHMDAKLTLSLFLVVSDRGSPNRSPSLDHPPRPPPLQIPANLLPFRSLCHRRVFFSTRQRSLEHGQEEEGRRCSCVCRRRERSRSGEEEGDRGGGGRGDGEEGEDGLIFWGCLWNTIYELRILLNYPLLESRRRLSLRIKDGEIMSQKSQLLSFPFNHHVLLLHSRRKHRSSRSRSLRGFPASGP